MVLARALASSRATITTRHRFLTTIRSSTLSPTTRTWQPYQPQCPFLVRDGNRRHYADASNERQERLIDALASLTEAERVAETGTPEERKAALVDIDAANRVISQASNLQRRRALGVLMEEMQALKGKRSSRLDRIAASKDVPKAREEPTVAALESAPVAEEADAAGHSGHASAYVADSVAGEQSAVESVPEEAAVADVQNSMIAEQADSSPVQAEGAVTNADGNATGAKAADLSAWDLASQDLTPRTVQAEVNADSPTTEAAGADSKEGAVTEHIEPVSPKEPGLPQSSMNDAVTVAEQTSAPVPPEPATDGSLADGPDMSKQLVQDHDGKEHTVDDSSSVDQWATEAAKSTTEKAAANSNTENPDGNLFRKEFDAYNFSIAAPEDPVKWELLPPIHARYRQLSLEDQSRLIMIRRRQEASFIRRVDKLWLRNACTCSACIDPVSGWKRFNITSVPENLPTEKIAFRPDGSLEIQWANDFLTKATHRSIFSPDILEYFNRPREQARARPSNAVQDQYRQLWNVDVLKEHPLRSVALKTFRKRDSAFVSAMESLHTQGVILINGTDDVPLEDVISTIGPAKNTFWGQSWDVAQEPMPRVQNRTDSGEALFPSSVMTWCHSPPRLFFLQCVENTVSGGEQVIVDGMKVAFDMVEFDRDNFTMLRTCPFRYTFKDFLPDGQPINYTARRAALHAAQDDHLIVRIDQKCMQTDLPHDTNSADKYNAARVALKAFASRAEDPTNRLAYRMQKGDVLVFDTSRILLGRNAFDPASGKRHFRAAAMDNDEWSAAIKPHDVRSANNRGDIPVCPPYQLQAWKLAGKDPANRPLPVVQGEVATMRRPWQASEGIGARKSLGLRAAEDRLPKLHRSRSIWTGKESEAKGAEEEKEGGLKFVPSVLDKV